jgi:iron complex outermembrane receptor protein
MRQLVIIFILLNISFYSFAFQTEAEGSFIVSGKVTDAAGNPLVGAVVSVENTLLGTSTSADGSYLLIIKRKDNYLLVASYMGYKREVVDVFVDTDSQINFVLTSESIMGEAVIVSATRASNRMPIAQTTINSDELNQRKTGFDIPYLLELVPSVVAISEGGTGIGNTSFRIRGTDMTRINVTANGIPLNDPESQGVWWVNMPDFAGSVDNVQIQRGVGTSTQGAGAFGATVNFQTTTLKPEPFAQAEIMSGSFNTFKTSVKAGTGLINNRFSFETRYSKLTSDGYIERGWSDHQSLFFTGAWHTEKSLLRFNIIRGEQHTGITWNGTPGYMLDVNRRYNPSGFMGVDDDNNQLFYPNESDNYNQNHYQLIYSRQLTSDINLNIAAYWIEGEGFYEQFKRRERLSKYGIEPIVIGDQTTTRTDLIRQKWLDNDLMGVSYSMSYNKGAFNSSFGGGFSQYDNDHFGKVLWTNINAGIPKDYQWYRNNGKKDDINFFIKSTYEIVNSISLFADLQYRTIDYILSGNDDDLQSLNQEHNWNFFNPKAGVFYKISSAQEAFVSVGVAHREPARADIKDAMKYGSLNTPKQERLIDYELGYNFKSQVFALGLNFYYMDYFDQLVLTGKLSDVGYPLMTNVDRSYRTGVEFMTGLMPSSWLRWDLNLTLSQNKILNFVEYVEYYNNPTDWSPIYDGNSLVQVVENLGTTDISFSPSIIGASILRVSPYKGMGVTFVSKYVGSQYLDNSSSTDRKLDSYLVNNLKLDYRFNLKGTKGLNLELMINNVFNKEYIANGWVYRAMFADGSDTYREDGFYPQAGINFMGRIVVEF